MGRGGQNNKRKAPAKPPAPPASLGTDEAAVWQHTCRGQNAEWLDTGPGALLENYCFAVVQTRKARGLFAKLAADPDNGPKDLAHQLANIDTLSKMSERLARALRLTPQSRIRADKADNLPGFPGADDDDDEDDTA